MTERLVAVKSAFVRLLHSVEFPAAVDGAFARCHNSPVIRSFCARKAH